MPEHPTPIRLAAEAFALWQKTGDPDSRSLIYAKADEDAANGGLGIVVPGDRRAINWVVAVHRYEGFWVLRGATPRENTRNRATLPAVERRMGEWARYQRRFEDGLTGYQKVRLDLSPAFAWDPHEHAWKTNLDQCASHLLFTGRLPYLNSSDQEEFALARWLGRQLRQLQTGTLPSSRVARLNALIAMELKHRR
jgi:hypothetical protein